jgi:glycerol-3-phosphate dehydrogenase subunit C
MGFEQHKVKNLDAFIKCSACTALCPVAAVHPFFPGPKCAGPDAERFRLEGVEMGTTLLNFCSNCKACEVTCPSGVKITDMILHAQEKALKIGQKKHEKTFSHRVRDLLLGRAEYLGRLGTILPNLTNVLLGAPLVRGLMELTLGISRQAPASCISSEV